MKLEYARYFKQDFLVLLEKLERYERALHIIASYENTPDCQHMAILEAKEALEEYIK